MFSLNDLLEMAKDLLFKVTLLRAVLPSWFPPKWGILWDFGPITRHERNSCLHMQALYTDWAFFHLVPLALALAALLFVARTRPKRPSKPAQASRIVALYFLVGTVLDAAVFVWSFYAEYDREQQNIIHFAVFVLAAACYGGVLVANNTLDGDASRELLVRYGELSGIVKDLERARTQDDERFADLETNQRLIANALERMMTTEKTKTSGKEGAEAPPPRGGPQRRLRNTSTPYSATPK